MTSQVRRRRQYAKPLHIDRLEEGGVVRALECIEFKASDVTEGSHSERWLQNLIFRFPQALPTGEIDPGLGTLVPVCLELPLSSGFVDNLYVTGDGDIVIAECKLWRNPEARREVVAQVIDYAHGLASWTYQELDQAVRKGVNPDNSRVNRALYEIVAAGTDIDEIRFVEAVSRNLRLGRMLLLLVGDGIREGAETLSDYLQIHAGFHFTLGLVEMPVFRLPTGGFVLQPRIVARTVNIERGIVRVVEGRASIEKLPDAPPVGRAQVSLSEERIIESIAAIAPEFPEALRRFVTASGEHGVFLEAAPKTLMARWSGPDESDFTLGGFSVDGTFITYSVNWRPDALGLVALAHEYLEEVAVLVGGSVKRTVTPAQWYVVSADGKVPMAMDVLRQGDAWIRLIVEYGDRLRHAIQGGTG